MIFQLKWHHTLEEKLTICGLGKALSSIRILFCLLRECVTLDLTNNCRRITFTLNISQKYRYLLTI